MVNSEWEIGDGSWIMVHGEPKIEEGRRESAMENSARMPRIRRIRTAGLGNAWIG